MDEIKKGWKIIVFTMLISNIGLGIFAWVKGAASVDYVDKQDQILRNEIDKKADKEAVEKMSKQIEFIYQDALTRANQNKK